MRQPKMWAMRCGVMRASRARPDLQDDYGYTYNHQPMLAYWKGRFYLEYLSAPRDEVFNAPAGRAATGEEKPCHTVLSVSSDGSSWSKPEVVFPAFEHHRVTPMISGTRNSLVCWVGGPPFR